ncbi:MAG: hypothetical protein LAO05_04990 [Acidobacteriia bacterium]|nr:hypothetical protein [Terriglobia bacterium]
MAREWTSPGLILIAALAACRTAAPPRITRLPDPTRPPLAGNPLTPAQVDAAQAAVARAEAGDFDGSAASRRSLPPGHPVGALVGLEVRFLKGEKVAGEALGLTKANPGYGSAWAFLALAASGESDLRGALAAARMAASLQPEAGWDRMTREFESGLLASLLAEGKAMLAAGDAQSALSRAREASQVSPDSAAAHLLAVRALLLLKDTRAAAALVPALPDTSEGLELKGQVAEALGQWDLALELYSRLPAEYPRRCELVAAARQGLRRSDAPPYLTRAFAASPVDRKGLAAIIAWEVPVLGKAAGDAVPVFEDVVQLAEGRDIVIVARAGVIPGDAIARRFGPGRVVSPRELGAALQRLAKALGKPAPLFCGDGDHLCLELPEVVNGETAATLVRRVAGGSGEPCAQR